MIRHTAANVALIIGALAVLLAVAVLVAVAIALTETVLTAALG